jgi:hypothetical protein
MFSVSSIFSYQIGRSLVNSFGIFAQLHELLLKVKIVENPNDPLYKEKMTLYKSDELIREYHCFKEQCIVNLIYFKDATAKLELHLKKSFYKSLPSPKEIKILSLLGDIEFEKICDNYQNLSFSWTFKNRETNEKMDLFNYILTRCLKIFMGRIEDSKYSYFDKGNPEIWKTIISQNHLKEFDYVALFICSYFQEQNCNRLIGCVLNQEGLNLNLENCESDMGLRKEILNSDIINHY